MNKNNVVKWTIIAGLWSVLLIPFYIANSMFFPYISGKNFIFRIVVEIIFALWVYLAYIDTKYRPKFSWLAVSVATFALALFIADINAVAPMKAFWSNYERMDGWITISHLLMYFLVFGSMMKTEKMWLWFFRSSAFASMIMVIYATNEWLNTGADRVSTTLGNPIYVAVYFLFNFFFVLILMYKDVIINSIHHKTGQLKSIFTNFLTYVYAIAAFLCVFGIWRTSTRGVILGLLGGLVITGLFIAIFEKENKLIRKFSVILLILIAVLVGGFLTIKNTQFVKNNATLSRLAAISWSSVNGQGQARQYVWGMALKGAQEKPILGWGQDGFNYVFNKYYDPRMYNQEQWFDRAHNTPLDVLIAGGVVGLVTYLSIFGFALYIIWKRRKALGIIDAGLLIGLLAGYFAQNLFVFDNLTSYIFFYAVLAYIYSRDTEDIHVAVEKNNKKEIQEDIANYIIAPILVIILGTSIWYLNIKPINANTDLILGLQQYSEGPSKNLEYLKSAIAYNTFGSPEIREQLISITPRVSNSNSDPKLKQEFAEFSYKQMQEQVAQTPNDARYQLFMGVFLNNMGQYEMAKSYLAKALELSPAKQTIMFEYIKCLSYLGEKAKALEIAKRAYEAETDSAEAKSNYVSALILNGKEAEVKKLFGDTVKPSSEVMIRTALVRAQLDLQKNDKNAAIAEIQKISADFPEFKAQGDNIIKGILDGTIK